MADPGFPVGGGGGAPTSNVGAFRQKHMRKRKNWIPLGGVAGAPPWIRQCYRQKIQQQIQKIKYGPKTTYFIAFYHCGMYMPLCDHFGVMMWMVTISYSRCRSLRLHLAGHCQYDVIKYDVVSVATLPHTAVVLCATI